jgi:putative oxidoreductase
MYFACWQNKKGGKMRKFLMVFFRVVLGVILISKGIMFGNNPHDLGTVLNASSMEFWSPWFIHILMFAHLVGGLFIIMGLKTRLASIIQVPILIGAVILNFSKGGMPSEFILSLSALILSCIYAYKGSGAFSVDHSITNDSPYASKDKHIHHV